MGYSLGLLSGPHDPSTQRVPVAPLPSPRTPTRRSRRSNQQDGYALLMKAAAHAIIDIARDPRFVGGTPGVLTVLHTWTQQLHYHPHVHCLVTGGGVSTGATPCWHPARPSYLAPETAIAKLVCGKLRAWFAQKRP